MTSSQHTADMQAQLWNGRAGQAWVDAQELLDALFEPFQQRLLADLPAGATRLLDVGCGTGSTTRAASRLLGSRGTCVGLDISEPMIRAARERAQREGLQAQFLCADAQSHAFEPGSFDVLISRFGVMFFRDPVQAFASLRRATAEQGSLRFIAWRSAAENPFMTTAERAAAPLLPAMPARPADGPGQFAFADAQRVEDILRRAGWAEISSEPLDVACAFPESELTRYFTRLGPLGLVLQDLDPGARENVIATVRQAFDPYVHGSEVRFKAACWQVAARANG